MKKQKTQEKHNTPGPADIVKVMAEEAHWNALEVTIESAGAELDWSDTPDNDREKAEIGAAVLMLAAPELLAALADLIKAARAVVPAKMNPRKAEHFAFMLAESMAYKAIHKAKGGN